MKESQILCVAFLYINMLHFLQQRVKMQFPSWSIDVVAGSGGPVCRSQCAGAQCAWLGRECTVGRIMSVNPSIPQQNGSRFSDNNLKLIFLGWCFCGLI